MAFIARLVWFAIGTLGWRSHPHGCSLRRQAALNSPAIPFTPCDESKGNRFLKKTFLLGKIFPDARQIEIVEER
jgi:hypothetical protein